MRSVGRSLGSKAETEEEAEAEAGAKPSAFGAVVVASRRWPPSLPPSPSLSPPGNIYPPRMELARSLEKRKARVFVQ